MDSDVIRELRGKWFPAMRTRTIRRLVHYLATDSPRLIRGVWGTPRKTRGCLAHWCGMDRKRLRTTVCPGLAWLNELGISRSLVVSAWEEDDGCTTFAAELLGVLKLELNRRCANGGHRLVNARHRDRDLLAEPRGQHGHRHDLLLAVEAGSVA